MTTTIIAPTTPIAPAIDPLIGCWQILHNGEVYGPTWTWKDVAAQHVLSCRKFFPGCWTLIDAKTGETVPCDTLEESFLAAQREYEQREDQEGWAETPAFPVPCAYCGSLADPVDTSDDYRHLAVNDPTCLGCLQSLAASHDFGQYAAA